MSKKIWKKAAAAVAVCLTAVLLAEIGLFAWVTSNKDTINGYLDEYETGTATFEDVRAVNLFWKDYVKIGETEKSDIVLSRSYWLFGLTIMRGCKKTDRMGNMFCYEGRHGETLTVVQTDEWCPFFRVYYVSKADG